MDSNFRYPVATVIGGQPSWEKALVARIRERIYWDRRFESTPLQHRFLSRGTRGESSAGLKVPRGSQKCTSARELEGTGFELVWGFSCQVVLFGLSPVLCSEREARSSSRRLRSGSRSARKGARDRNASKA